MEPAPERAGCPNLLLAWLVYGPIEAIRLAPAKKCDAGSRWIEACKPFKMPLDCPKV